MGKQPVQKQWNLDEVEKFIGWDGLMSVIKEGEMERDRALMATLFCTGCRIHEVIAGEEEFTDRGFGLKKEHFNFDRHKNYVVVYNVKVLKAYDKIGEQKKWKCVNSGCGFRWDEKPKIEGRHDIKEYTGYKTKEGKRLRDIPIKKDLLPTEIMIDWVKNLDHRSDYLFPDLDYHNSWRICKEAGKNSINEKTPPHWFRAQRASQIGWVDRANLQELMKYFEWTNEEIAKKYSKGDVEDLIKRGIG